MPEERGIDAFNARRTAGNQLISECNHLGLSRFMRLDAMAYEDGALPGKTKELLGLVASAVLRCNDCIDYHVEQCTKSGHTREEIVDALNIAVIVGGSIVIPHLRHALQTLGEVAEEGTAGEGT